MRNLQYTLIITLLLTRFVAHGSLSSILYYIPTTIMGIEIQMSLLLLLTYDMIILLEDCEKGSTSYNEQAN